jgi:hypothetical protein
MKGFYVGLIHFPVVNRNKEIITSSVTNLDLHDIARASRTYGVTGYFVIHPSQDQQALNRRIVRHWEGRYGTDMNPTRKDALQLLRLAYGFDETIEQIRQEQGQAPLVVGTHAQPMGDRSVSLVDLRQRLQTQPVYLVFGTAYGLDKSWIDRMDAFLPPIYGPSDYNHLSVRSAVSIYLDRLFGAEAPLLTKSPPLAISEG